MPEKLSAKGRLDNYDRILVQISAEAWWPICCESSLPLARSAAGTGQATRLYVPR